MKVAKKEKKTKKKEKRERMVNRLKTRPQKKSQLMKTNLKRILFSKMI